MLQPVENALFDSPGHKVATVPYSEVRTGRVAGARIRRWKSHKFLFFV